MELAAFLDRKLLYDWLKVNLFEDVAFYAHEREPIKSPLPHSVPEIFLD